uniref:Uncharacterized protein n=1 Tax=Chenopodium quinoa TaxID=63459 RepID=A0A803MAA2_CHEQI
RLIKNEKNGRIEIDCNAAGVLFEEAKTTYPLAHYGDFKPNSELRKLVLPTCDYTGGLSSLLLLLTKLTRFKCGAVCLARVTHHFIADGIGQTYFFNSWAMLARGDNLAVLPVHESYKASTFEVLTGHVWRSTRKARGLTGDQCVKLYIVTDGRSRLKDPTLPEGYFGNVTMKTVCIAKAE